MARIEEIEKRKEELKKIGIAQFKIMIGQKELSEDESIGRSIDESWSFFFACIRDPYFNRGYSSKNLGFRIFQILKEKPSIPMGYSGMPSFTFEDYTGRPAKTAIEILKSKLKNKYIYKAKDDRIICQRVISEQEKQQKKQQQQEGKKKYLVDDSDSPEVKAIKEKIQKLERTKEIYKEINWRIRKGETLEGLGFSEETIKKLLAPDCIGRVGIPDYELTSLNGKIKRLKAKIK